MTIVNLIDMPEAEAIAMAEGLDDFYFPEDPINWSAKERIAFNINGMNGVELFREIERQLIHLDCITAFERIKRRRVEWA